MPTLSCDFETRSTVDLRKTGVYVYAADPTTDVWCLAWAIGNDPVELWHPGLRVPLALCVHIDSGGEMRAHNAQFERIIWREILGPRYGFPVPDPDRWHCTAAEAAAMALPRSLDGVSQVLPKIAFTKDMEGHRLMMQMARPRRVEDDGTLVWWDDAGRRERLYSYCKTDVETERAVAARLRRLSPVERAVYLLDQRANDRGVLIDRPLVVAAQEVVEEGLRRANNELDTLTRGEVGAVTRVGQLTDWLRDSGLDIPNLDKAVVRDLLKTELTPVQRRVLQIRADAGKSSTSKLKTMLAVMGADDHARGLLLYHGASTGRWSGRLIQTHNFPRGTVADVESYIPAILDGSYDDMLLLGQNPMEIVSSMLRSMLRASPGNRLMAGDFSQVEARVLGWMAGEPYGNLEYERMAAAIFGIPLEEVEKEHRQVGKNTVLGAGFQMGWQRFQEQIAEQTGVSLSDELAERSIRTFRETKQGIPRFWTGINAAAMEAVREKGETTYAGVNGMLRFVYRAGFLWCVLPSGRALAYADPQLQMRTRIWTDKDGKETGRSTRLGLQYKSVNSMTSKWTTVHAYGGLLTENVVQATARDLMAAAMLRLERAGYPVILTVHDEVICDVPEGHGSLEDFNRIMEILPRWAEGCPIAAESWEGERYRK